MTAALALAAALAAAPPAPAPAVPRPATPVGEVVVPGGPAPKLVASWPAQGGATGAGVLTLKLVFDQALDPKAPLTLEAAPGSPPLECLRTPRLLADARTLVLLCRAQAKTTYDLKIAGPANLGGRPAAEVSLKFASTDEVVDNTGDALKAAGLAEADEPVVAWRGDETGAPPRSAATAPNSAAGVPAAAANLPHPQT